MSIKKRIYLDYAATTAKEIGNPSSIHQEGVKAKKKLDEARRKKGAAFGGRAGEKIFFFCAPGTNET